MNSQTVSTFNYPSTDAPQSQAAIQLTQDLIRIPSLTAITPDLMPAAKSSLDFLEGYLSSYGASCHRMEFEGGNEKWGYPVDNLYAEWAMDGAEQHLCFMGHTDVVAPGDHSLWSAEPFSGDVIDDWIYGRGATDMKGAVATFCVAAARLVSQGKIPPVHISLIITSDEEWVAANGTIKVLEWMSQNNRKPDAILIGEPSSSDVFGSHIKVGRRGSLCGTLKVPGTQGHAAYKDLFDNPNRALSLANTLLNAHSWDNNIPHFPATNFEIIAQEAGSFSNSSIVPNKAEALWNVRFTPEYTPERIDEVIRTLLSEPPEWARSHPDCEGLKKINVSSHIDTVSMPYYSAPGLFASITAEAVEHHTGITPVMDGTGGTTDGRFVHDFFPDAQIVELGLPEKGGCPNDVRPSDYGQRGGMHQVDERCSINDIQKLLLCYQEIIAKFASSTQRK